MIILSWIKTLQWIKSHTANFQRILIRKRNIDEELNVKSRKRNGFYDKNSAATKWRRNNEAKKVNPRDTLLNYFTVAEKKEDDKVADAHTKQEIYDIKRCISLLDELVKPVMNYKVDGSTVKSYEHVRYLSVKLYFTYRLEGYNKGDALKMTAKFYWPQSKINCSMV